MRPWNFSAGPSVLPLEVLEQAAAELLSWHDCGMSVMEMSHRGKEFMQIRDEAEADLRDLLQVPADFEVLFMQGGAQAQNAIVPMNLMGLKPGRKADYVVSGSWSDKSQKEAGRYGAVNIAATSATSTHIDGHEQLPYTWFPGVDEWHLQAEASYIHVCSNETISGVEFNDWSNFNVPLVVDASSNILSRPTDFSKVDMMYAGAQKMRALQALLWSLCVKICLDSPIATARASLITSRWRLISRCSILLLPTLFIFLAWSING